MKIGIRKPSYKTSFSAKTKGRLTRSAKKITSPGYGMKGVGVIKNPKRALYNYGYSRTTTSIIKKTSCNSSYIKSRSYSGTYPSKAKSYKPVKYIIKPNNSKVNYSGKYSSSYRCNTNIREIYKEQIYLQENIEVKQEDGLYLEDLTWNFEMNYNNEIDENYNPLKLNHNDFELTNITRKRIYLDNSKYKQIVKEKKCNFININNINSLSHIKKIEEEYSVSGPRFKTIKPNGYVEYEGLEFFTKEFEYIENYGTDCNLYSLYMDLSYDGQAKVAFEIKEKDNVFHIYAYYDKANKLQKGYVGFIKDDEINSQLSLCSHIDLQLKDMLLNKPRFKLFIKEDEYEVIIKYKKELEQTRSEKIQLLQNRIQYQDIAYQFVILGVDFENKKYLNDAILSYEKSIELGYSIPFVYERLFLIYNMKNDYKNAIRVLSKGIEDLTLLSDLGANKSLDCKIACYEKLLDKMNKEKVIFDSKNDSNNSKNNKFFNMCNLTKSIFTHRIIKENLVINDKNIYKLLKPLKLLEEDIVEKKFYSFKPKGYSSYNKISKFGYDVYFYDTFNYDYFCENKKIINEKNLSLFKDKIRSENYINMDFELEDRDNCIYITAYFKDKNNVLKCDIGFIVNEEIANELRAYEDIKVFIKSYEYDRIGLNIFVK